MGFKLRPLLHAVHCSKYLMLLHVQPKLAAEQSGSNTRASRDVPSICTPSCLNLRRQVQNSMVALPKLKVNQVNISLVSLLHILRFTGKVHLHLGAPHCPPSRRGSSDLFSKAPERKLCKSRKEINEVGKKPAARCTMAYHVVQTKSKRQTVKEIQ